MRTPNLFDRFLMSVGIFFITIGFSFVSWSRARVEGRTFVRVLKEYQDKLGRTFG